MVGSGNFLEAISTLEELARINMQGSDYEVHKVHLTKHKLNVSPTQIPLSWIPRMLVIFQTPPDTGKCGKHYARLQVTEVLIGYS